MKLKIVFKQIAVVFIKSDINYLQSIYCSKQNEKGDEACLIQMKMTKNQFKAINTQQK